MPLMFENHGSFLLGDIAHVEDMDSRMHTLTKQISKTMTAVFLWKKNTGGLNCFGYRVKAANFTKVQQSYLWPVPFSAEKELPNLSESVIRSEFFGSLRPSMTSQKWGLKHHFVVLRVFFGGIVCCCFGLGMYRPFGISTNVLNITVDYETHF